MIEIKRVTISNEYAESIIDTRRRNKVAFMMLDLDKFKEINDRDALVERDTI